MDGKITISRRNYGCGKKVISIEVKDTSSRIRFLDIELSLEDFAECLMGLSEIDCSIKTRGLEHIGKTMETDTINFKMPSVVHDKNIAYKIAESKAPNGWIASSYFGSKDSFYTVDNELWAKAKLTRYV